jgi:hypothetical protein
MSHFPGSLSEPYGHGSYFFGSGPAGENIWRAHLETIEIEHVFDQHCFTNSPLRTWMCLASRVKNDRLTDLARCQDTEVTEIVRGESSPIGWYLLRHLRDHWPRALVEEFLSGRLEGVSHSADVESTSDVRCKLSSLPRSLRASDSNRRSWDHGWQGVWIVHRWEKLKTWGPYPTYPETRGDNDQDLYRNVYSRFPLPPTLQWISLVVPVRSQWWNDFVLWSSVEQMRGKLQSSNPSVKARMTLESITQTEKRWDICSLACVSLTLAMIDFGLDWPRYR